MWGCVFGGGGYGPLGTVNEKEPPHLSQQGTKLSTPPNTIQSTAVVPYHDSTEHRRVIGQFKRGWGCPCGVCLITVHTH